jgi:hypothetical protein
VEGEVRCQTHVASSYRGDASGRFHDRAYRVGEAMAWWPRGDRRWGEWRVWGGRGGVSDREGEAGEAGEADEEREEEACYADCAACGAELYVIVRFRAAVVEWVLGIGRVEDWPDGYLR